ncbi:MAG: glycosyltransferase family 2 protein [Candidatus Parcubacteria bacterium]|nr:glycosyltransferase family 2 protein [Candidatus Parcubacteria bacterium]
MSKVSIVILNWNGKKFLKNCLDSLTQLTYSQIEIIVVDNNSSDGSQEFVKKNYKKVILIGNKENYGFAKGNNIGFKASTGDYILILNNDTIVTSNFLSPLIRDFENDPKIVCLQPQIRLSKNRQLLDGVGAFLTFTGFLYHFGYLKNRMQPKYNKRMKIFSAKGACMLLRRKAIEKVGLFDEDFFIFFEETDLCFRLWLAGYSVVYEPESVIYHLGGGDTTSSNSYQDEKRLYMSIRNMFCCYLKNFGIYNLLTVMPVFIFTQIVLCFYYLITLRLNLVKVIIKAYYWNISNLPSTIKKRNNVQKNIRKVSDYGLNKYIFHNPRISYYNYLLIGKLKEYKE